jgi:hypothetical protein
MPRQIAFFILFLLPVFSFSQVKVSEVVIPPSKDTARIRFTTTTVTTTEYKVDYLTTAPGNKAPIASAGNDVAITLPVNTVTLSAISSTDADGTIASYKWSQVSGPAATLAQSNTALNASNLTQGVYVFRVTVTDNGGLVDNDEVNVVVNAAPTGTRQNIIYEDGFERDNPGQLYESERQWCCSYSVTSATDVVREGNRSVRMEHRGSDPKVSSGERVELKSSTKFRSLSEVWYGYSVYFKGSWPSFSGNEHLPQWHPASSSGGMVLGMWTGKGTFDLRTNPSGGSSSNSLVSNPKRIEPNKWYDFVWHIKWGNPGLLEVWINGEVYFSKAISTSTSGIPYFKFGLNGWSYPSDLDRVFYLDALRIGNGSATYKDVAP